MPHTVRAPDSLQQLLGVDSTASAKTIKAAYKRQMRTLHPDVAGSQATELASLLNLAYTTLSAQAEQDAAGPGARAAVLESCSGAGADLSALAHR